MHLSEGQLKTYIDKELDRTALEEAQAHLDTCEQCQSYAREILTRTGNVSEYLAILAPQRVDSPIPARVARTRLEAYVSEKENNSMFNQLFTRKFRPVWVILGVVVLLSVSLAFPQVRAAAVNFLGLFRVQQVTVVPINPANLPQSMGQAEPLIRQIFSKDLQVEKGGESQAVATAAEASKMAGIPIRLPGGLEGQPKLSLQPASRMSFKVDLPQIRAILQEIGRSDIQLPDNLNGATITVELPASVTATYGNCKMTSQEARQAGFDPDNPASWQTDCTIFVQLSSPTVSAPAGLDVEKIGEAFLRLTGMSPADAQRFSQTVDWTTTLVIPVPSSASYQEVQVDGVTGALIQESSSQTNNPHYILVWVKNSVVYALEGQGDATNALSIANSVK